MLMLPYTIFRELYLQSIREHAHVTWAMCHADGVQVIPNFPGC